ncbi:hypothetical protein SYNTR_1473 [Candidatus Syntrophocurvum alkaliphilum]|uniref:Tetratricopeptide repeat protein n=1 Tax=Candidatus Syntrophocurvum alkaliphilum TaxID=2293317 RepID=A0A6I6DG28_9FIRM|nr:tetratricopeptide repeat protein [Candidatus Syntrophocurvum alkaliphilum]QGU00067.1 hypothetical protein SYNTR_1473 [Candidatus Syntrophocurvum alkaliphilum]
MKENNETYDQALDSILKGDLTKALKQLHSVREIEPNNVEIMNLLASCYFTLGELQEAEQLWYKVLQIDADNKEAKDKINYIASPSFNFWIKRYLNALNLVENKSYESAQQELIQLLKENDKIITIYQLLGLCYLAQGEKIQARKIWEKGLELDKSNTQLIDYLSLQPDKLLESKFETEHKLIDKTVDQSSTNSKKVKWAWPVAGVLVVAILVQGAFALNNNRVNNEVINNLEYRVNQLSQSLDQQKNELAVAVSSITNSNTSNTDEKYADTLAGSNYDISKERHYFDAGYDAYLSNDYKTAINNLSVVVAMDTKSYINREAAYYIARCYYLIKDLQMAEKYYLNYLSDFPNTNYYDDSLYFLGCVYYENNDIDKAKATFERLKEYNPSSGYIAKDLYKKVMK